MSIGDYARYQRALKGGPTPWEIAEQSGVSSSTYRQIEQRYREVAEDDDLRKLAAYYGITEDEMLKRKGWSRKALNAALVDAKEQERPIRLDLRTGESFTGQVLWSDLGAVHLRLEDGRELVVQRHVVDFWELLE